MTASHATLDALGIKGRPDPWPKKDAAGDMAESAAQLAEWMARQRQAAEALVHLPKGQLPTVRRLSFGPLPRRLVRRAWLARFNPDDPRRHTVFGTTDPLDFPWDDVRSAVSDPWLSSEPDAGTPKAPFATPAWTRIANRYQEMLVDDLVFVLSSGAGRTEARRDLFGAPTTWPRPAIVGVWYVAARRTVPRRATAPSGGLEIRSTDDVLFAPLVLFNEPVPVKHARRADSTGNGFSAISALSLPEGIAQLPERDALQMAADCSLQSRIFTAPDLDAVARDLDAVFTGPTDAVRAISLPARVHLTRLHDEARAIVAVWRDLRRHQFLVWDMSRIGGLGHDLEAVARFRGGQFIRRLVEVKAHYGRGTFDYDRRLQPSQKHAARHYALHDPKGWVLAIVSAGDNIAYLDAAAVASKLSGQP